MKFNHKTKIIIMYGDKLDKQLTISSPNTEIKWVNNHFEITGKLPEETTDGKDS